MLLRIKSAGAFYLNMVIHGQGQVQMTMRRTNNEKEKQPYLSQGWLAQLQGWWGLESRKRWKWTERTNEECVDKSAICWQKIFWLQSLPLPRSIRTKSTILIVKFNCFAWFSWRAPKSIVASFKEIYQLISYWLGTEKYRHREKRERKERRKGKGRTWSRGNPWSSKKKISIDYSIQAKQVAQRAISFFWAVLGWSEISFTPFLFSERFHLKQNQRLNSWIMWPLWLNMSGIEWALNWGGIVLIIEQGGPEQGTRGDEGWIFQ